MEKENKIYSQEEFLTELLTERGYLKKAIDDGSENNLIGMEIMLLNKQALNGYNLYQIADFNHDGTFYTVDLIAKCTMRSRCFDSETNDYTNSDIRSWLNYVYLDGFAKEIKDKLCIMNVQTEINNKIITTTNDKVKLLSIDELGITTKHDYMPTANEGNKYPIFTNTGIAAATNRVRSGARSYWWLRSRNTSSTVYAWVVYSDGSLDYSRYYSSYGILPVIRFSIS